MGAVESGRKDRYNVGNPHNELALISHNYKLGHTGTGTVFNIHIN
jgi:hypothetical protein